MLLIKLSCEQAFHLLKTYEINYCYCVPLSETHVYELDSDELFDIFQNCIGKMHAYRLISHMVLQLQVHIMILI